MGMILDGIAASEAVDSSGEILLVEGADISDLEEGRGTLNWEHRGDDAPGASANDHIGRIVYAKKLYKRDDCENERQRKYWDFVKLPCIYIKAELFDGEGHPGAVAAAAMIRHYQTRDIPILIRYSIEGSTLEKDGNVLKRTIARRVAATIKPANKSCISGVVKDGSEATKEQTPDDPLAAILKDDAKKFEAPDRMKLGGSVTVACDPEFTVEASVVTAATKLRDMAKAIDAGSYNAAPGTLTGGAALQVEDQSRRAKVYATCKAALRDYDPEKHGAFRKYLAAELPEASDEFLDRFEQLAGEWAVKKREAFLKKDEDGAPDPSDELEPPKKPFKERLANHRSRVKGIRDQHETAFLPEQVKDMPAVPPSETKGFQIAPRKVDRGGAYFDEDKGVLYVGEYPSNSQFKATGKRAFKLYIPHEDEYHQLLRDPHINAIHDAAVKNWMTLHKLVRSGRMPPEVIAHAALFSAMSPRTAVPLQELAFGFTQDLVDKGWDPTKAMPDAQRDAWKREWDAITIDGERLPQYMNDHYSRPEVRQNWTTPEGRRHIIALGQGKWDSATDYHLMHDAVAKLAAEHGADGRAIAGRLMQMKSDYGNWQSRLYSFNRAKKANGGEAPLDRKGNPKQSPPPPDHPGVEGFANKTIRYMLGMAGYGNVMVPDTHFIRHSFGFMPDDPHNDIVKQFLTKRNYEHINQGIDRYYFAHHPAVAHTREKIRSQYGEDIGEHALFPGFWMHWLTVGPHDRQRKWDAGQVQNEGTDHAVYWNAVRRVLDKYGIPWEDHRLQKGEETWEKGGSMAARTAHAMHEIEERFGYTPATFAFHAWMLPALLSHSKHPLLKAQRLAEDLRKAAGETPAQKTEPMKVGDSLVHPGVLHVDGEQYALLKVGQPGGFHIINAPGKGNMKVRAVPEAKVVAAPRVVRGGTLVDSVAHGLPHLSTLPEQTDLLHGIDLKSAVSVPAAPGTSLKSTSEQRAPEATGWRQSAAGALGYVKPASTMTHLVALLGDKGFTAAHREAAFYRLAKEFFGLGDHVPVTAAFKHPMTGEPHSVSKQVEGGEHHQETNPLHDSLLMHLGETGSLDKLALMDMVMNSNDRHRMNYMLTRHAPFVHLIDNGLTLAPPGEGFITDVPHYWKRYNEQMHDEEWAHEPLHPEAERWAMGLDPKKLDEQMERMGVPATPRKEAVRRLTTLRNRVARGGASKGAAFFAPFINPRRAQPPTAMVEEH